MGKIEFVLSEFFRSFRKNLLKDILLMVMITIGSVMSVILCSYYLDLNEKNDLLNSQRIEDGTWYSAGFVGNDDEYFYEQLSSIKGCNNIINYFEEIAYDEKNPMFFVDTQQSMNAVVDEVENLFNQDDYKKFTTEDNPLPFSAVIDGEIHTVIDLKCIHVDYNAYKIFGFKTIEGEGITDKNTLLVSLKEEVPIVLGNAYKGIIEVGDKLRLSIVGNVYPCKVIGILEENSYCYEYGNTNVEQINIDNYILFPYGIRFRDVDGEYEDISKYAVWDMHTLTNGSNVLVGNSRSDLTEIVQKYYAISQEYSLPSLKLDGVSLGLKMLRNESKERVQIMLMITIALICFTLYSLFSAVYDKIQSNKKIYGIYLVNGCSLKMIVASYIMEIIVIVLPSIMTGIYIFDPYKLGYVVGNITSILALVYGIGAVVIMIVSLYAMYMIKKVDTEQLIREE